MSRPTCATNFIEKYSLLAIVLTSILIRFIITYINYTQSVKEPTNPISNTLSSLRSILILTEQRAGHSASDADR